MDVREIDGADPRVARRLWEIGRDAEAAHRRYDFYWPWPTAEVTLRDGRAGWETRLLGGFNDEELVAVATVSAPLLDNTHLAYVGVFVTPSRQRRGFGRALADRAESAARDLGRRVLGTEAYAPAEEQSAGLAFALSLGYTAALEDTIKVVELDATEPSWAALEKEAAARSVGYTLVTWHDAVPAAHVEGYCRLNEAFYEEAPMGELDFEPEVWDEDRTRKREADNHAAGRHDVSTAVLSPDGEMVGLTEIMVNHHAAHRGVQSGTLVLPGHRGRALGLAMKVRNQRALRERFPGCKILMTGNAGVNLAMNALNDRLGYRPIERCVELQKEL
ncbi:hypothetical protein BH18ACT9_BH18ACT9_03630 [soil metagenome]